MAGLMAESGLDAASRAGVMGKPQFSMTIFTVSGGDRVSMA
jgi:hypothetical protein